MSQQQEKSPKFDAVLFDLDGTLLDSRMDVLLPQYFKRLSARVIHLMPAQMFIDHLMRATQAMVDNDGQETNEAVFADAFYPSLGCPRCEIEPIMNDFYEHDFPQLQTCTHCIDDARAAVQSAFTCGCRVVIATNPLFPATAIHQRLAWAGVADFPYALITTYEYSRSSKPNLRYYQQILDDIGCSAERSLVVGDEAWDMVAAKLGCSTFLVTSHATKPDVEALNPTYRGTLADVSALLMPSVLD